MKSLNELKKSLGDESGRRVVTAALLLLAVVSALAWFQASRRMRPAPVAAAAPVAQPEPAQLAAADLARLLGASGAAQAEAAPSQRFVVMGVLAGASGQGAALIAVDGQPPKPFRVGAEVAPGFVLKRLAAREVMLAERIDGPVTLTLPLPAWEPRSKAGGPEGAPGAPEAGAAPRAGGEAAPQPGGAPPESPVTAQPGRRGDQRGP